MTEFDKICRDGDMNAIIKFIDHNEKIYWNDGLRGACYGGHKEIVDLMILLGAADWNLGLDGACSSGNMDMVLLMISKGADNYNDALFEAWLGKHIEIILFLIGKGANNWQRMFKAACYTNYLIPFVMSKGVNNWTDGLEYACWGKQKDLITKLISLGANIHHSALYYACGSGSKEIVDMIFSLSSKEYSHAEYSQALFGACNSGNKELILLMIEKGARINDRCILDFVDIYYLYKKGIKKFDKYDDVYKKCIMTEFLVKLNLTKIQILPEIINHIVDY